MDKFKKKIQEQAKSTQGTRTDLTSSPNGEKDWKLTFAKTGKRKNVKVNDYSLTLDIAKELSMVENNKIGGWYFYT